MFCLHKTLEDANGKEYGRIKEEASYSAVLLRGKSPKNKIFVVQSSFRLEIFRLREVIQKCRHTDVYLRFCIMKTTRVDIYFANYKRKITSQNRLLPKEYRRWVQSKIYRKVAVHLTATFHCYKNSPIPILKDLCLYIPIFFDNLFCHG